DRPREFPGRRFHGPHPQRELISNSQFPEGRSTRSITRNSFGAAAGSSFRPNCSLKTVKIDGPVGSAALPVFALQTGKFAFPAQNSAPSEAGGEFSSGPYSNSKSNRPAIPVLSITGRPARRPSRLEKDFRLSACSATAIFGPFLPAPCSQSACPGSGVCRG